MNPHGWGQSQSKDRFTLTADQVARALSERGAPVAGQQVDLLANVVASEPYPSLDVLIVEPLATQRLGKSIDGDRTLVKMACHEPGKCLPFYAIVLWPKGLPANESTVSGSRPGMVLNSANRSNTAITMRAGTHATLVMDDGRSHIQVAVITLESGVLGHSIRVASPDHKQVYTAEVVSASLLRRGY